MIYLDNAATSLQKPKEVEEAVIRAFHTMGNPGRGAHEATLQAGRGVYQDEERAGVACSWQKKKESMDRIITSNGYRGKLISLRLLGVLPQGGSCGSLPVLRTIIRFLRPL